MPRMSDTLLQGILKESNSVTTYVLPEGIDWADEDEDGAPLCTVESHLNTEDKPRPTADRVALHWQHLVEGAVA